MKKVLSIILGLTSSFLLYTSPVYAQDLHNPSETFSISKKVKHDINKDFYNWAAQRAKIGNMAVSHYYFDHGPDEDGKLWYAPTPDGDVLIRNASDEYNSKDYTLKKLGGVVFYTSENGTTGKCNDIAHDTDNGAIYSSDEVDASKPIDKYILANNGIIYECKLDGYSAEPDSGFYIKGDDNDSKSDSWIISKDKDAQNEYRQLIEKYTGNEVTTPIDYNKSSDSSTTNSESNNNQDSTDNSNQTQATNDNQAENDGMDHTAQVGKVIGDVKTHIYHTADQHNYKIKPKNEVVFSNEQDAINAGYRKALR